MSDEHLTEPQSERKWRPLSAAQRRVAGVLVEKAKTTPDAYPMTLNALTNGCNQKSNRAPLMDLSPDDVQNALDQLREMGAVAEVQAGGRVPKYRHYLYEWLGVEKAAMAVMTELLLRGEQTLGELRGRASRMEPIADLNALQLVLQSLLEKQLIVELTSAGRGQVVTHNLYSPTRLAELKEQYASGAVSPSRPSTTTRRRPRRRFLWKNFEALKGLVDELSEEMESLRDAFEQLKG